MEQWRDVAFYEHRIDNTTNQLRIFSGFRREAVLCVPASPARARPAYIFVRCSATREPLLMSPQRELPS